MPGMLPGPRITAVSEAAKFLLGRHSRTSGEMGTRQRTLLFQSGTHCDEGGKQGAGEVVAGGDGRIFLAGVQGRPLRTF